MGVKRLLVGPAGSGKTHQILEEFKAEIFGANPLEKSSFLILPSAEHVERLVSLVLMNSPAPGFFYRRITTLPRFTRDFFLTGEEIFLSTNARFLILRDLFATHDWEYFREHKNVPGFIELFAHFILELKDSMMTPEAFRIRMNVLKKTEPDLAAKYEALADIYECYEKKLETDGSFDRQDSLRFFRGRKQEETFRSRKLKKVWLDGFFDFTPLQLEYLSEMSEICEDLTVTLTFDERKNSGGLFDSIFETADDLKELGFVMESVGDSNKRANAKPLVNLERKLFSGESGVLSDADSAIQIFESVGIQGEMEMIAKEIARLYQAGQHRFSDFAILFRQIGNYESVIRSVFAQHEIPIEMHERERLNQSGMIHAISLLLKIFREGWKNHDVVDFLKSSYVLRLGESEKNYLWVSEFERQAREKGVASGREAWLSSQVDVGPLKILFDLEDQLRSAKTYSHLKKMLFEALYLKFGILSIHESSQDWVKRDAAASRRFEAILEEIRIHYGSGHENLSFDAFCDHFFRLVELDLYPVHNEDKNRVQIYDISLARQKEYRVVFVSGLLEKCFPMQMREDPILSDWERVLLGQEKPQLRQRLPRQKMERYLFYIAVTRARERLYLTYPRLDREGKEQLPSFYVDEVKRLFKEAVPVKKQDLSRPYPLIEDARTEEDLRVALMGSLWDVEQAESDFLAVMLQQEFEDSVSAAIWARAFTRPDAKLKEVAWAERFFRAERMSATRLEEYAKCHYKYFANKILKLKDLEEDVNVKQKGIVLHQVLERFFQEAIRQPQLMQKKEALRFVESELNKALVEHPLVFDRKYQKDLAVDEMRAMLKAFLENEIERLSESKMKPFLLEMGFGSSRNKDKAPDYPFFEVEVQGGKASFSGFIDRIDKSVSGEFGSVMDYKRTANYKRDDLELGVMLQLPLYLLVMEKFLGLKPVSGELYSIKECRASGFYHAENAQEVMKVSARAQKFTEPEYRALIERSLAFIRRFISEMRTKNIEVRPRVCDSFCAFGPVCRIEKWKLPLILEKIKEEDAEWLGKK